MTGVPETVVEIVHGYKPVKVLSMLRLFLPVVIAAKGAPAHPLVMPVRGTTLSRPVVVKQLPGHSLPKTDGTV